MKKRGEMDYKNSQKPLLIVILFSFLLLLFANFSATLSYSQTADTLDKEDFKKFVKTEFEKSKKEMQQYVEINIKNTEHWISFAKTVATILGVLIALVFGFQILKSIQMDREYNRIIEIRKEAQKIVEKTTDDLDNIKKLLSSLVESSVKEYANVIKETVKGEISKEFISPLTEKSGVKSEIYEIEDKLNKVEGQIQLLQKLKANVTPNMYISKGLMAIYELKIPEAIQSLETALEIEPHNTRAIKNLTEVYILNGDYQLSNDFAIKKSKFIIQLEDKIILQQLLVTARCLGGLDYTKDLKTFLDLLRANRDFTLAGLWRFDDMEKFLNRIETDQNKKNFLFNLIKLLTKKITLEEFESVLELDI